MAAHSNVYEDLYQNLMKTFTVDCNGKDATLGEYMMNKTTAVTETNSIAVSVYRPARLAVMSFAQFVGDKLTVKVPPVKDKTIRRFPLRTSLSAALTATAFCGLLLSFTVLGVKSAVASANDPVSYQAEIEEDQTSAENIHSEQL